MAVIDVQVHAYERNHPGRPWAGQLHGPASANGAEMVAAMDTVGVDAAIIVSTFNLYRYDPSYALEVYAKYPERFRVAAGDRHIGKRAVAARRHATTAAILPPPSSATLRPRTGSASLRSPWKAVRQHRRAVVRPM
jgi:predicted TIM-barrel fold metal-dependent hydrolase